MQRRDHAAPSGVPRGRRQLRAEAAITLPITVFACFGVWAELHYATGPVPWPPGGYLLTVGAAAGLLLRRSRPLLGALVCLAGVAGYHVAGYPGLAPSVLAFPLCYALGAYVPRRGLLLGLLTAGVIWLILTLPPHPLPWYALDVSMPALAYGAAAVLGESARRRRLEHEERVRQEAAATEERLRRRLAEERMRIAQELHDVVAHTISVVAVQSSVALDALATVDTVPPAVNAVPPAVNEARDAIRLARAAARQALPELRAALEMLRGDSGAPRESLPQPDLAQLPALVAQIARSGLAVQLEMDEHNPELSPLLQLTAYRIIQEALTNTLRHARAQHASVRVVRGESQLEVEVADDGAGAAQPGGGSGLHGGFGLRGMRERAEALGGRLDAGPRAEGGFLVRAELPCELQ